MAKYRVIFVSKKTDQNVYGYYIKFVEKITKSILLLRCYQPNMAKNIMKPAEI